MTAKYECSECGNSNFRMYVMQRIFVSFETHPEGEVYDGPESDMGWNDNTEVRCQSCDHSGSLKSMEART